MARKKTDHAQRIERGEWIEEMLSIDFEDHITTHSIITWVTDGLRILDVEKAEATSNDPVIKCLCTVNFSTFDCLREGNNAPLLEEVNSFLQEYFLTNCENNEGMKARWTYDVCGVVMHTVATWFLVRSFFIELDILNKKYSKTFTIEEFFSDDRFDRLQPKLNRAHLRYMLESFNRVQRQLCNDAGHFYFKNHIPSPGKSSLAGLPSCIDLPAIISKIFFTFIIDGGHEYIGHCEQCFKFIISRRKGRRTLCSDVCKTNAFIAREAKKEEGKKKINTD